MRAVPVDDIMAAVIKKVGVIGAGQMGNGIAHVAALAGFDVVLNDISADRLKSRMTRPRRWRASRRPKSSTTSPIATS